MRNKKKKKEKRKKKEKKKGWGGGAYLTCLILPNHSLSLEKRLIKRLVQYIAPARISFPFAALHSIRSKMTSSKAVASVPVPIRAMAETK